jgi:hypothetical protein
MKIIFNIIINNHYRKIVKQLIKKFYTVIVKIKKIYIINKINYNKYKIIPIEIQSKFKKYSIKK